MLKNDTDTESPCQHNVFAVVSIAGHEHNYVHKVLFNRPQRFGLVQFVILRASNMAHFYDVVVHGHEGKIDDGDSDVGHGDV